MVVQDFCPFFARRAAFLPRRLCSRDRGHDDACHLLSVIHLTKSFGIGMVTGGCTAPLLSTYFLAFNKMIMKSSTWPLLSRSFPKFDPKGERGAKDHWARWIEWHPSHESVSSLSVISLRLEWRPRRYAVRRLSHVNSWHRCLHPAAVFPACLDTYHIVQNFLDPCQLPVTCAIISTFVYVLCC